MKTKEHSTKNLNLTNETLNLTEHFNTDIGASPNEYSSRLEINF